MDVIANNCQNKSRVRISEESCHRSADEVAIPSSSGTIREDGIRRKCGGNFVDMEFWVKHWNWDLWAFTGLLSSRKWKWHTSSQYRQNKE